MRYRFTDFLLDTDRFQLTRSGAPVHLEPQAMELLVMLVTAGDRVLSRNEIHQRVWKGRVVSDAALSSRIRTLRQALGDDGRNQNLIQTVSKKGFRFVADVICLNPDVADSSVGHTAVIPESKTEKVIDLTDARPSLAVLPFTNLSGDLDQEYFSDGITEDIITALSKFRWFFVVSRNSTFVYKNKAVDIKQVGQDLDVNYALEGSVRKSGERIRITAQLIETETGNHVWAERYDRDLKDMFDLQDEITSTIAAAVEPELADSERHRAKRKPTENLGAWDLFHRGVAAMWRQEKDTIEHGYDLVRQATALDENFGQAYGYLAIGAFFLLVYEWAEEPESTLQRGLGDAAKAVAIDQRDYFAFHALGRLQTMAGNFGAAERALKTCLNINPYFALGYVGLGEAHVYGGDPERAIDYLDEAIRLSPNDPFKWDMYHYKASAMIRLDDFAGAIENFERACEFPTAQYVPYATLAALYVINGQMQEGRRALENSRRLEPNVSLARMKQIYGPAADKPGSRSYRLIQAMQTAGLT